MVENIKINPNELREILLDYYKNECKNAKIVFKTSEELVGYHEDKVAVTRIILKQDISLGNQIVNKEREIAKEELKEVLNEILKEQGYEVIDLIFNNEKKYIGYCEDVTHIFKGINLNVRNRQKQKIK